MDHLHRILFGEGQTWHFLLECVLRTSAMFVVALLLFRLTGKKEVRQFSILELIVIIGLGSALGDAMFYADVGMLPALVAILVVLLLYRFVNIWTNRAPRVGDWLEGKVRVVYADGVLDRDALDREGLSIDELFGDLRVKHVEHLGQLKSAHVEINGVLSIFFHPDHEAHFGMPIHPGCMQEAVRSSVLPEGPASCANCARTVAPGPPPHTCPLCQHTLWLPAMKQPRIA